MSELIIVFIIPFAISLVLSLYASPRMRIISYNGMGYLGRKPDQNHGMEMGGIPLFPIMLVSICFTLITPHVLLKEEWYMLVDTAILRILQIFVGCSFLYLMGVKDDFHGTGTNRKFMILLVTAAMFPASSLWINNLHGLFGIYGIPAWLGMPFSLFLCMFMTQLPSISDSPDGLATGVCTLLLAMFLALCLYGHFSLGAIITAAAVGVALPFSIGKRFSRKWEKTLIGSSGNYVFGYILSYMVLGMVRQCGGTLPEEALVLCIGIPFVPVMDALRVLRSRIVEGRDLLKPDRNQMQHLLFRAGISQTWAPRVSMLVIMSIPLINLQLAYLHLQMTVIFIIDVLLWVLFRFFVDWIIHNREASEAHEVWNKEYGREAWEANIPTDILSRKIEVYGTMGLPAHMVSDDVNEFVQDGMNGFGRAVKRIFDVLVAAFCLVVFSPLFLLCYVLVRLQDGGPAIYRQERLGRFGRPFYIYKFRSMRMDAEVSGPALSHAGGDDDPRLTKLGKFLRAHHLDELPQLWNVLIGDMSFVGYRPERKFFIDQIMENDPRYSFLYQIRPGVTSYSTLRYGYTDTMEKMLRRLELDLYYLKNHSLWFDVKVLFLTFAGIIFGKKF